LELGRYWMRFASAAYGWQLGSLHHEGESRLEEFGIMMKGKLNKKKKK
jgi:hypothetical protein